MKRAIAVSMSAEPVPADGKSIVKIRVHVLDAWGVAIPSGYVVTSAADSIQYLGTDADVKTPGMQTQLDNGAAEFSVKAPRQAGQYDMQFSANGLKTLASVEFSTPVEPLILIGSADATGSMLHASGDVCMDGRARHVQSEPKLAVLN